jgi:pyruvate-formate lyase
MVFYTPFSEPRPVRLCEETRMFAWESMHGKYGDEARSNPAVSLDHIPGFSELTDTKKYNIAIVEIAKNAPLRLCEAEKVCGSATLGSAINHVVPAFYKGSPVFGSVSHLTPDFMTVVKYGIHKIEDDIANRSRDEALTEEQRVTLDSFQNSIASLRVYHNRYQEAAKIKNQKAYEALKRVPFDTPRSFFEAVQSLWFAFSFLRLCGNWPGIGRIDEMLGGFLKQDLEVQTLSIDEAREILAGFFIKGCEWIESNTVPGSGDAQHYQNIILGGINEDGEDITNEVSYLVLDIVEELAISDFPITVRVNEKTPRHFLERVAEVIRHGGGVIAVYNEALVLEALDRIGYDKAEARSFANDGCWEVQIPGKTCFSYVPFDSLRILLNDTLHLDTDTPAHFDSMIALYKAFYKNLQNTVDRICSEAVDWYFDRFENPHKDVCSVISVFEQGCIQKARGYHNGGTVYRVVSPHIGGAPDAGNSLYAIQKLVFEDKKVAFDDLMQVLKNNWEGAEALRLYALNHYTYYGNDHDEADAYTVRIINDFGDMVEAWQGKSPIIFTGGVSTFGRQIEWAPFRLATPFGKRKGDILSGNDSPTPGTDTEGATAMIRSYCKADLKKMGTGAALDIKLEPGTLGGRNGIDALVALIEGFCKLGGYFMQLDVVEAKVLKLAQENPEAYKTLSVRVSGWNARFVTLNREWQQMIIERSEKNSL